MSNNLVSQQLSIPNMEMGQIESAYAKADSSVLNMQMDMMRPMSNNLASHQFAISGQNMELVEPMCYISGSQKLTATNRQMEQMEPMVDGMGSQKLIANQKAGETEAMLNSIGSQKMILPTKRKAAEESMFSSSLPQQLLMSNKRPTHMQPIITTHELMQQSGTSKNSVQLQSMVCAPGTQNSPAPNKKIVRNESMSSKSGTQRIKTQKSRTVQIEPPRKVQTESFEAVRSKMRESLAAALALVCQDQTIASNEQKSSPPKVGITMQQQPEDSPHADSSRVCAADVPGNTKDTLPSKETSSDDKPNEIRSTFSETSIREGMRSSPQVWRSSEQESLYNTVLPDADIPFGDNFFVKDELLQGNGLSWAWDMDVEEVVDSKEVQIAEHVDGGEKRTRSPQELAFKIEEELFKLFRGVNKKYKEKGRSLMFNLKDQNNPELRERVMSGEILPEKLCSMTAEELASKELSQWRMAKAEELAQMIVLPDSDGDRRRLVKKTHKGEYQVQVEVEQDDGVSVEVSVGTTTLTQRRPKEKEIGVSLSSEAEQIKGRDHFTGEKGDYVAGEKGSPENHGSSCSLTIPADGADLMQGLIVDEFKDADFLPPIVSLDEFMESLNSEPPFDNLSVDADQAKHLLEKDKSESGNILVASDPVSENAVDISSDKAAKMDMKVVDLEVDVKSSNAPAKSKTSAPDSASMAKYVWEGALQLQISTMVTVIGLFISGEKTSAKEWPSSLEIKGRVRFDAFEKFIQELPMSRSRAVMVVNFVLKAGCSDDDRASLGEAVESYVVDERLGFAEPAPGVEIYFCPPHRKVVELVSKHLAKDQSEILNSTENGLIGVVVWRKAHLISPNASSHHKHSSSKKQNHFSPRGQVKDTNVVNANLTPGIPVPLTRPGQLPPSNDDEDDDIPPGFGPGTVRDDDDLPEFNFSGSLNSPTPMPPQPSRPGSFNPPSRSSRPVDQIRELIHKYGQTGNSGSPRNWPDKRSGIEIEPWNDDDDDDDGIPEWRPEAPQRPIQPQPPIHGFQQPMQPHVAPRHLLAQQPPVPMLIQPQINMTQVINPTLQQGGRWAQPQGFQPNSLVGQQYQTGQPVANRRYDPPRSRGF